MKLNPLFFLLFVFNGFLSQQKLATTTLSLPNLKAIESLEIELQKAINYEKKCNNYSNSLVWTISLNETDNGCLLVVSMQSELNINHQYSGFFHLDSTLFVTSGAIDSNLFLIGELKQLKVSYYKQNLKDAVIPELEDYSNWLFLFKNNILILVKEYVLPCELKN